MLLLILVAVSCALAVFSESIRRAGNPAWRLFAVVAVLALSIINLVRDYSIGTDIGVYGNFIFTSAVYSESLGSFLKVCEQAGGVEPGYGVLNYVVALFSDNPHVFYFALGLVTNGIAYIILYKLRSVTSVSLGWLVYELMFFPTTLNAMRQSVAIVLVMLATVYAMDSRMRSSVLMLLLACSFHRSGVIGLPIILSARMWCHQPSHLDDARMDSRRSKLLVAIVAAAFLLPVIIGKLDSMGLLGEKYSNYLAGSSDRDLLSPILVRLPLVVLAVFDIVRGPSRENARSNIILLLMLVETCLLPLKLVSDAAFRISLYFGIFKIAAYPAAVIRLDGLLRIPGKASLVAYLIFVFWWQTVLNGSGEIWPFLVASEFGL